jgi:hypothetical protein
MPGESQFEIGARASCSDGACGEVRRIVVDPATDVVTHLVIEHKHRHGAGRLVPTGLVDTTGGDIRLRCTLAEFDRLDHAEERQFADPADEEAGSGGLLGDDMIYGVGGQAYGRMAMRTGSVPGRRKTIIQDVVPVGETQVRPGDRVHATDGEIGRIHGFIVNPGDDQVTHVLLEEGHLWGHKEVAIPVTAVTGVEEGIRLNITKEQVENLPPVH